MVGWTDQLLLRTPFLTRPPERTKARSSPKRGPSDSLHLTVGEWPRLSFTARVQRGPSSHLRFSSCHSFRSHSQGNPDCGRRTSTVSSCAFREQRDALAASLSPLLQYRQNLFSYFLLLLPTRDGLAGWKREASRARVQRYTCCFQACSFLSRDGG